MLQFGESGAGRIKGSGIGSGKILIGDVAIVIPEQIAEIK